MAAVMPDPVSYLMFRAETLASQKGFPFTPECAKNLRTLLESRTNLLTTSTEIEQGESNVVRLIDAMIVEAQSHQLTDLHEFTLSGALSKLCPLFPFC